MERMLRKRKNNSDYEIDRELTGKFAIEKNAEYQDRIAELEEENKNLKERISELEDVSKDYDLLSKDFIALGKENEELKDTMKELNNYIKFIIQENERQKSKTITVTDEDNRIILEKGEDGKWHSYGGGNVVLC